MNTNSWMKEQYDWVCERLAIWFDETENKAIDLMWFAISFGFAWYLCLELVLFLIQCGHDGIDKIDLSGLAFESGTVCTSLLK